METYVGIWRVMEVYVVILVDNVMHTHLLVLCTGLFRPWYS